MKDLMIQHTVASYECGADMLLKPECLMHFCQEIAERHASINGLGYEWGMENHLIWVETQGDFQFIRRPRWKEEVFLRTNTGKATLLQARRFVEMTDTQGNILARADLMWVLIQVATRRPVPLKKAQLELTDSCPPTISTPLPPDPGAMEEETSHFIAPKRDVDFNGHINNSAYLIWVLETLPETVSQGKSPLRIHIDFKHECHAGDQMTLIHRFNGKMSRHSIMCGNELRAEVRLVWEEA